MLKYIYENDKLGKVVMVGKINILWKSNNFGVEFIKRYG